MPDRGTAGSCQQPHSWQLEEPQYVDPKRCSGRLTTLSLVVLAVNVGGAGIPVGCNIAGIRKASEADSVH